jgi:hypothetical protein
LLAVFACAGCSTTSWLHDRDTATLLAAAGFRVARAEDGPPPAGLRPGRMERRIDRAGVRYFYLDPLDGALLAGDEEARMLYEQLRLGRAGPVEPAVFLGFSYGAPVGF